MSHDFQSAQHEAEDIFALQDYFQERGWSDGLPVMPPTPDRVSQFLDFCKLQPEDLICIIPTRNRSITAEKVAINCVMAGCRPAFMPVVVAVLQAMSAVEFNFHGSITSTGGSAQFILVNGPLRQELDMNSGVNLFGADTRANATIGRAVRLVLINVADAHPGILDKSTQGHPGKISFCIAEAEEISPWEPFHVERGFDVGTSTVTVFAAEGPHSIQNHESGDPEELLKCMAGEIASIGGFSEGQCALIMAPEHANIVARSGWSKAEIKRFLFDHAYQSLADLRALGKYGSGFPGPLDDGTRARRLAEAGWSDAEVEAREAYRAAAREGDPEACKVHRGHGPDDIILAVAGGAAGGHSAFIPSWSRGRGSLYQTRAIAG